MSEPQLQQPTSAWGLGTTLIDALKASPVILCMLLIVGLFWGGFGYLLSVAIAAHHAEKMLMLERCLVPPAKETHA